MWRNRAKRVMRETARRAGGPWAGYDALLIARRETGDARPDDLYAALLSLLARAGVTR